MCYVASFLEDKGASTADLRSFNHFSQLGIEQRFQAFADEYDTPGGRQTELADIKMIDKVPVYFINAVNDEVCEGPDVIKQYESEIPSFAQTFTMETYTHEDFLAPIGEESKSMYQAIQVYLDESMMSQESGSKALTAMIFASAATLASMLI